MAMAVQKLFPNSKVTIGPWIDNGFYYDFDMEPLTDKDLKKIKKEMDRIIRRNLPLVREEVSREEAQKRIQALNEPYKLEILERIKEEPITIYHIGEEWWDLCAGPHVESTGKIQRKAVELESVAGAYWRGDENNQMLQRIYGTAWESEDQLKAYIHFKEEAKRRDHRRLGQDLDLFSIQEDAGGGLVFWHPKGAIIRHILEDSWKQTHLQRGYDLLYTPHVAKADLWKISGHIDFYKENMYNQMDVEDEPYQLRPMNCPYHILVYKRKLQSYRDLPIRVAELGTVYRYELSGALHGLFRVRGFTQDDAHIFCLEDQIKDEIRGVLDLTEEILGQFGFRNFEVNLSTRPEKSVGSEDIWEKATIALKDALDDKGWGYTVDEGGGAFYGPKIDLKIEDALGRKWQCSTVQVDFNLPERFDITYIDSHTEKKRPIMIHRAILGSLERFFGILIENYAGDFPLWLAPTQARILPVTNNELQYCNEVASELKSRGIRAEVCHGERLPKLIRNAETQKVPLMAVVGPKEVEARTLTIRNSALSTSRGSQFSHMIDNKTPQLTLVEEEDEDGEKVPEHIDLGPILSIKDQLEKDKDDESLRRWKEQLLGSVDLNSVGETLEPDVKIMSLSIQSPGRPDIFLPLPVEPTSGKGVWFTLKEGSPYKLKFTFSVSNNIVSGLRYTNTVWKTGIKGTSSKNE
ncbi:unnamed protein product [Triticum turgidum subsp. durum]|uniref:threonine--tRNA ligase n=1 Tax=Triticum turgidum subsp. durum TaxID=4567 RepID=A0A9R1B272_TRITD|nr:unnamed protein product [Triticum turgidum subsp. durum]